MLALDVTEDVPVVVALDVRLEVTVDVNVVCCLQSRNVPNW